MSKILVIDDLREFSFKAIYARTSKEALDILYQEWDEIWLDHDLGEEDTIKPILDFIQEKSFYGDKTFDNTQFIVHSANPYGAKMMVAVLERCCYYVVRINANDFLKKTG